MNKKRRFQVKGGENSESTTKEILNNKNLELLEKYQKENEVLLRQLHFIQEKLERIYAEKHFQETHKKPLYGAGERVKSSLSYRIGNTFVRSSRSISGVIALPFALRREVKAYRQNNEIMVMKNMPLLEDYSDYALALRAKKHLSYKIGEIIVANYSSISKWPMMLKSVFLIVLKK